MNNRKSVLKLAISALCLALAYVLPFVTGQIPKLGQMLLTMHIPVLLCGFICGWGWGLGVGLIAPILRSLNLGAPVLFPTAICMALELAAYGAGTGIFYKILPKRKRFIYVSLALSMICGRIVWGIAMAICLGLSGDAFTFNAFIAGAIINALPGILIQLILIPILVISLERLRIYERL